MIDKSKFYSLDVSEKWRLFRDNQDRLENTKIELQTTRNKFESLTEENDKLRAKLEKAEKVIELALGLLPHPLIFTQIERALALALKEYRGEETK